MIALLPKLTWTLSISSFFYVEVSLKEYSSPLNMQNKTSSRTTLLQSFFIWSLWRHRETSKPLRKVELKCNSTIVVLKTNTQAFLDNSQRWYSEHPCSYCIKKNVLMEISLLFYVLCDRFWSCFETERFRKTLFRRHKWLKTKVLWNSTSNQREKKTVHQIGLPQWP